MGADWILGGGRAFVNPELKGHSTAVGDKLLRGEIVRDEVDVEERGSGLTHLHHLHFQDSHALSGPDDGSG